MADQELLAIVWGETSGLAAKDRNDETLRRLHSVVAKLAATAQRRGLGSKLKQLLAPRANDDVKMAAYNAVSSAVKSINADAYHPEIELPARAVLWEVNENGVPRRDKVPPKSVSWIFDANVTSGGDFVAGSGVDTRTYRLFEFAKAPADDELPFVSGYSGSGVVVSEGPRPWYRSPNWGIGLLGGALFFLASFSLLWTASSFSQAYDLMSNRQVGLAGAFIASSCPAGADADQSKYCLTEEDSKKTAAERKPIYEKKLADFAADASTCVKHLTDWAISEEAAREALAKTGKLAQPQRNNPELDVPCLKLLGYAVTYSAKSLVIKADTFVGRVAQFIGNGLFGWHVPADGLQAVSLGMPSSLMMLGVVLVLVGLGRGVTGSPLGALISPNGRYSLALAQVTFWTILILTSVMAIAIFNGGLVSELVRYFAKATSFPDAAVKGFFPYIPEGIWAVLGISFGTTAVSVLFKSIKGDVSDSSPSAIAEGRSQQIGGVGFLKSPIAGADPAHRGSIADWFLGEEEANKDKIDISRVQMVLITAGLLVTYGNAIFAAVRDLAPQEIILAIQNVQILISTLPPVGASMAIMLAVSHATYLLSKAADKPATHGQ
ncbi:hypothetical protein [Tardiphaga robiniae]|uniref:hypothetical protein n=1 Tax=Tardiphaga robiniae TaxID=943830 RepID=UPI0015867066|nr:hypothetical protein [Tardiphaga robiniae]NUU41566.1 hypothetical protein [Tardiphaga robiniae]